jgi:hypothetical protein
MRRFREIREVSREERLMPHFNVEEIEKEFSPEAFKGVSLTPNFSKRNEKREERLMPRFNVEEIEKEFSPESFRM